MTKALGRKNEEEHRLQALRRDGLGICEIEDLLREESNGA